MKLTQGRQMKRRAVIGGGMAVAIIPMAQAETVGVTKTEIRIGHTTPYSGFASGFGAIGRLHTTFFRQVNDLGGIGGRKVNLISLDDQYSPPKAVEQVHHLVEKDKVAFIFNTLGSPVNTAIRGYLNDRKVPHLFVGGGIGDWADAKRYPWTIGWQPSVQAEVGIFAAYIRQGNAQPKLALFHGNDPSGMACLVALKQALGADYANIVIKEAVHAAGDASVDNELMSMRKSGADTLMTASTPAMNAKLLALAEREGWRPRVLVPSALSLLGLPAAGTRAGMPAGAITTVYLKDPADPAWRNEGDIAEWQRFRAHYAPDLAPDAVSAYAYAVASTMLRVLRQCGDDLSRENIMRQALDLKNLYVPLLLPGIAVDTSPTDFRPIERMQLARWSGSRWEPFGGLAGSPNRQECASGCTLDSNGTCQCPK